MSDYEFKAGDRVKFSSWQGVVVGTHNDYVWVCCDGDGYAEAFRPDDLTLIPPPPPPLPHVWLNIYPQDGHMTRERADRRAFPDRVAVVEVKPDGDAVVHRVTG